MTAETDPVPHDLPAPAPDAAAPAEKKAAAPKKKKEVSATPPSTQRASGRERKVVVPVYEPVEKKAPVKLDLGQGEGTRLRDIANVVFLLGKYKVDDDVVIGLHKVLYGKPGVKTVRRRDILEFNGFATEEEAAKAKERLGRLTTTELSALCGVFQLGLGKGAESTKDGKVSRLADYLLRPAPQSDVDLAAKQEKKKEKKTKDATKKRKATDGAGPAPKKKKKAAVAVDEEEGSESEDEDEDEGEKALTDEEIQAVRDVVSASDKDKVGMKTLMKELEGRLGEGIRAKKEAVEALALELL